MASAQRLEVDVEVKCDVKKFWNSIRDSSTLFPKAFPDQYESIQVLEGDGKSVGSVRLVKFAPGMSMISTSKEKIEVVDEEKKSVSYSVIDGDLLKYYKNFKAHLVVTPKGGGSLVKWSCEFDKASEEVPNPDLMKDFAVKNFQDLDAFLLKA
ncbi:MLP 423 [Olea europaea subsp. europaea]|uniref:MLP 423 n=1 Tax=Olea europaea subsp. europaea TaxID=158383 RepID=A0A8S0QX97_OLEEU|nr:MLP 423 [Olea europaea subsp. europaea]